MASRRAPRLWAGAGMVALFGSVAAAQAFNLDYCATVNTANTGPFESEFQSMGRCHDNCTAADMPLAILQDHNCWCSTLAPSLPDQKPLTDCTAACPGYPSDFCGGAGTFGYFKLKNPLGTAAPGAADTQTSSTSTAEHTLTLPPPVNDDDAPKTPTPSVQTVTVGGVIKTVTATPSTTATPGDDSTALVNAGQGSGLSTGATVGVAIGVVGIVAIAAIFFFMYFLKRRRKEAGEGLFIASRRGSSPGMASTPKTGEVSETRYADTPATGPIWDVGAASERRSHLRPVDPRIDPRLDPFAKGIYARDLNKSHDSISSLQDNQDYSRRIQAPPRVLRATNPDPDPDD